MKTVNQKLLWGAVLALVCGCEGLAVFADEPGTEDGISSAHDLSVHPSLDGCKAVKQLGGEFDETLPSGSCFVVTEDLMVHGTAQLGPGTKLGFAPGTGILIAEDGALLAVGTEDEPIVLTGLADQPGGWSGLSFRPDSRGNLMQHVEVDGAGGGAPSTSAEAAAIYVGSRAQIALDDVIVRRSAGAGIALEAGARALGLEGVSFDDNAGEDVVRVGEGSVGEGGEEQPGSACDEGRTACSAQRVMACIDGTFEAIKDCSEHVDSGTTTCAMYDGAARCIRPPPATCRQVLTEAKSGVPMSSLTEHSRGCVGEVACEEASLRTCALTNLSGEPFAFSGEGSQWVGLVTYDEVGKGVLNQVSGVELSIRSKGDYALHVYVDKGRHAVAALDRKPDPCGQDVWASSRTGSLTAVWPTAPAVQREKILRVHVEHIGGECAPWTLVVSPNPCPGFDSPAGATCTPLAD